MDLIVLNFIGEAPVSMGGMPKPANVFGTLNPDELIVLKDY